MMGELAVLLILQCCILYEIIFYEILSNLTYIMMSELAVSLILQCCILYKIIFYEIFDYFPGSARGEDCV